MEWKSFLHDIIISRTQLFLRVQILTYWNFSRLFEWIRLSKLSLFASLTEYALYKDVATMTICNLCCDTISPSFPQSCHSPANVAHLEVVLTTVAYCLLRVCCVWCLLVMSKNSNNTYVRTEVPKIWVPSPKIPARSIFIVEVQKAFGAWEGFQLFLKCDCEVFQHSFLKASAAIINEIQLTFL